MAGILKVKNGNTWVDIPAIVGPQGVPGVPGPQGLPGPKGDPGDVQSVAGKTGAVTLDAGDVEYDDTDTYAAGSVGAGLADLKSHDDILDFDFIPSTESETAVGSYHALIFKTYIQATSNTNFNMWKYPVDSGKHYKLILKNARMNYDTYGIAAFSTVSFDGETTISGITQIIPPGDTATAKDYDVNFTAPDDGYIYVCLYGSGGSIAIYEAQIGSVLINNLTNTKDQVIKLQAFGDSITDDSWRSDHTTWLSLLPDYITQRTWAITNSAVGGAHMGHGKTSGQKYDNLDYNWVYDLVINPDILDTSSDIIVISAGTNDYNSGHLGEWGDTTPIVEGRTYTDSFYGAVYAICDYITKNTHAILFLCTPIARPSYADADKPLDANGEPIRQGHSLRDYADAIIKTANLFQVPVIDNFHDLGWNRYNTAYWMDPQNSIHPSPKGANVMSAFMTSIIKDHLGI